MNAGRQAPRREASHPSFAIKLSARVLRNGGVVAYPTEGVYGLGCDPDDADAVARLLALKQRPADRGLIVLAAAFTDLERYVAGMPDAALARMLSTWPGPVTWLVPARRSAPPWLTGGSDRIAVRVTAHPVARALCEAAGTGIVSTSANLSGRPPARSALSVRRLFGGSVDAILTGRAGPLLGPTPILDALSGSVLRAG